jgi:hypothetical protein
VLSTCLVLLVDISKGFLESGNIDAIHTVQSLQEQELAQLPLQLVQELQELIHILVSDVSQEPQVLR